VTKNTSEEGGGGK